MSKQVQFPLKQSLYETFSKQIKPVTTTLTTLNKPLQQVNKNVKTETRQPTFEDGLGINSNRQMQKQQDLKEQRLKQQKQFEQEQKEIQERVKQQQILQKQQLQKQQQSQLQLQSRPQQSQQSSRGEQISSQYSRNPQQPIAKSRPVEQSKDVAQPLPQQSQRAQQFPQSQQLKAQQQQQQTFSIPVYQQQSQQIRPQQAQSNQQSARQPPQQQISQQQQRPIAKEQQIQKQQPTPQPRQQVPAAPPSEYPDDERLYECPEGCGRSFNARALEKHSKVCQKVFQQKRKAFNSAEQRIVEEEIQVIKPVQQKKGAKKEPEKKAPEGKQQAKPKWLAQSEAFRAVIKQAKGAELTKEESAQLKQTMEESQGLVQCKFCGRKFNAETAKKHIVFCETKSKQQVSKPKKK